MKLTKVRGFPQISRFFSAAGLWAGLIGIFLLNLALQGTIDPTRSNHITAVLTHPFSVNNHVALAQTMRRQQQDVLATQELLVATELLAKKGATNVLGATTDPAGLLKEWQTEAERLARAYRFWRDIAAEKPDYPDAQLVAAALAFQQSDFSEAARFAQTTLVLDPNNAEAEQLIITLARSH